MFDEIVVSLKKMNKVLEIDAEAGVAVVEVLNISPGGWRGPTRS